MFRQEISVSVVVWSVVIGLILFIGMAPIGAALLWEQVYIRNWTFDTKWTRQYGEMTTQAAPTAQPDKVKN